ncbi:MAG: hypothetical protein CMO80_02595 [Verrucomicrobiales bacterium]|nr:hypothetical protein [Verrucomicrobiales bacterium]
MVTLNSSLGKLITNHMRPDKPMPNPDAASSESRSPNTLSFLLLLVASCAAFFLGKGPAKEFTDGNQPTTIPSESEPNVEGRELAKTLCASCHLEPLPEVATRDRWAFEILPQAALHLGIEPFDPSQHPGGEEVVKADALTAKPAISQNDWRAVANHYLATAPDDHPYISGSDGALPKTTIFRPAPLNHPDSTRMSTVRIDPSAKVIYIGNADTPSLEVVSPAGQVLAARKMPGPILSIGIQPNGLLITIGRPERNNDLSEGALMFLGKPGTSAPGEQVLIPGLVRPAHLQLANLNTYSGSGFLIAEYGRYTGQLRWFAKTDSGVESHLLTDEPGINALAVSDLNGNGRSDVVAVQANGHQKILAFQRTSNGFTHRTLLQHHPAWNYTDVTVIDMNGDGLPDLVTSNGDDERLSAQDEPLVPFHGIRIQVATADGTYRESYTYHLNRARRVAAGDFDADGDIDIVAIGYSSNHRNTARHGAVYLENQGNLTFKPQELPLSGDARWHDLDIGDLDQDGDLDIALIAMHPGRRVPPALLAKWSESPVTAVFLINQTIP